MDNREAIKKTIEKIAQLSRLPGNEWLLRELRSKWGSMPDGNDNSDSITNIERYLAIDYNIDEISAKIDYGFVQDEVLRIKLESDWREMLRYRCGVRKHERDFLEFCRYANLQAEGIVNYYCYTKYPTEEDLKNKCNEYYSQATEIKDPRSYCAVKGESASYNNKLNMIRVEANLPLSAVITLFQDIYQARNLQSHRSSLTSEKTDKIEKLQAWLAKTPYDEVEQVLGTLVAVIKNALTENNTK